MSTVVALCLLVAKDSLDSKENVTEFVLSHPYKNQLDRSCPVYHHCGKSRTREYGLLAQTELQAGSDQRQDTDNKPAQSQLQAPLPQSHCNLTPCLLCPNFSLPPALCPGASVSPAQQQSSLAPSIQSCVRRSSSRHLPTHSALRSSFPSPSPSVHSLCTLLLAPLRARPDSSPAVHPSIHPTLRSVACLLACLLSLGLLAVFLLPSYPSFSFLILISSAVLPYEFFELSPERLWFWQTQIDRQHTTES